MLRRPREAMEITVLMIDRKRYYSQIMNCMASIKQCLYSTEQSVAKPTWIGLIVASEYTAR
jgi:hypothetical protein